MIKISKYCYGYSEKLGLCECEDCDLDLIDCALVSDDCGRWAIAVGENDLKCKRDNPAGKYTKKQFLEIYHKIPAGRRTEKWMGLMDMYKQAQLEGIVEKEDRLLNES